MWGKATTLPAHPAAQERAGHAVERRRVELFWNIGTGVALLNLGFLRHRDAQNKPDHYRGDSKMGRLPSLLDARARLEMLDRLMSGKVGQRGRGPPKTREGPDDARVKGTATARRPRPLTDSWSNPIPPNADRMRSVPVTLALKGDLGILGLKTARQSQKKVLASSRERAALRGYL